MSQNDRCEITESRRDGVCVLHLSGVLDGPAGVDLERRVGPLLLAGSKRLVIDLHGLQYVASAGVGAILTCLRRIKAVGGVLVLAHPSESVREMITTLNLSALLPVLETVERGVLAAAHG